MIDNPADSIAFLRSVFESLQTTDVSVDLSGVQHITPDALLALVTFRDAIRRPHHLFGNLPRALGPREIVRTCGFDQLVGGLGEHSRLAKTGYTTTKRVALRRGYKTDPASVYATVANACAQAGRPYHRISYSNLIECMTNTKDHAARDPGTVAWRAMVARDEKARKLTFVFMDAGLGICKTVVGRLGLLRLSGDGALLELLLDPAQSGYRRLFAGLPSQTRTGVRGRGRGLIKIAQSLTRGNLSRLVVVANSGYVDLSAGSVQTLAMPFRGTMLVWEIDDPAPGATSHDEPPRTGAA